MCGHHCGVLGSISQTSLGNSFTTELFGFSRTDSSSPNPKTNNMHCFSLTAQTTMNNVTPSTCFIEQRLDRIDVLKNLNLLQLINNIIERRII